MFNRWVWSGYSPSRGFNRICFEQLEGILSGVEWSARPGRARNGCSSGRLVSSDPWVNWQRIICSADGVVVDELSHCIQPAMMASLHAQNSQ